MQARRYVLQCGHGPKAVENRQRPSLRRSGGTVASMRPRPEGRGEHNGVKINASHDIDASMRPRPEGRGEPRLRVLQVASTLDASMRPRPEGRGEPPEAVAGVTSDGPVLQCGHGPKAVENQRSSLRRATRSSTVLQCGHGPKAVENIAVRDRHAAASAGFNAATARRPWRTSAAIMAFAQWRSCFNAATARRPWRTTACGTLRPCRTDCFNAATARRPWRTMADTAARSDFAVMLQCGHGPKAVENADCRDPNGDMPGASMRPRPEGRGERRCPVPCVPVASGASMRPRPEGRGEPLALSTESRCTVSFNAATARRPWRTATRKTTSRPLRSFNAATARRPWRTTWQTSPRRRHATLQCGHGPKAVENRCGSVRNAVQSHGRFNAATARRPWRTDKSHEHEPGRHAASMRPRPEGRGEPEGLVVYALTQWRLQCGHGPKAVENSVTIMVASGSAPSLQCGHGPKAVENSRCRSSGAAGDDGFNAATARRPWRTRRTPRRTARQPCRLQCGHGPKAVENRCMGLAMFADGDGFNAATARRPWRTPAVGVRVDGGREGFNAATARRPWRTEHARVDGRRRWWCFNAATARRPWRTPA